LDKVCLTLRILKSVQLLTLSSQANKFQTSS